MRRKHEQKSIVRLYRVGFGDCIYVQIPDNHDTFTMLIDCGTSASAETTLKPAVNHICSQLPTDQDGKPRLDLLVVTHPHADHMKGFDPAWFQGVTIRRIWMTVFMNQAHPRQKKPWLSRKQRLPQPNPCLIVRAYT